MPSLTPADRQALLGPRDGRTCPQCHAPQVTHYCRSHDEFFVACRCTGQSPHDEPCRIYWWTPHAILAIPNFDGFADGAMGKERKR